MDTTEITTTTTDEPRPQPTDVRLVRIVSLSDDEFDDAVAEHGAGAADLTPYLSQWDYGEENDHAAVVNGYTPLADAQRFGTEEIVHDGITYWCAPDDGLRMCTLLREPLTPPENES